LIAVPGQVEILASAISRLGEEVSMRMQNSWIIGFLGLFLTGCGAPEKSSRGFRFPDGNAERGRIAFLELGCHSCHQVEGMEERGWGAALERPIVLGGEVLYARTDGELLTSIINPSHKVAKRHPPEMVQVDGRSRMKVYGDEMTVRQLIDIVAFLHTRYRTTPPPIGTY
jgi:hypothetical protein